MVMFDWAFRLPKRTLPKSFVGDLRSMTSSRPSSSSWLAIASDIRVMFDPLSRITLTDCPASSKPSCSSESSRGAVALNESPAELIAPGGEEER